jgi:hypothetical protein
MAFLDGFSEDERQFLAALPYRTGLWISSSDSAGGHDASAQERDALEKTIQGIVQGMFESAFVHEIMAETFLHRDQWPVWAGQATSIPEDCKKAVAMMQSRKLPIRDIDAYRHILMQIGLEVARAFREHHKDEPVFFRITRSIGLTFDRLFGIVQGEKYVSEDLLNISYNEDLALNALATALRGTDGAGMVSNS